MPNHRRKSQQKAIDRHFEEARKWEEAVSKEREDFRANDPKWQALRSNPKYQTAVAKFITAWNDARKRLGDEATHHTVISDPAVKKWANQKSRFELGYQVHDGEPWELANTPELFLQFIERHKLVIWRVTAGQPGADTLIIEDAYKKAVFMATRNQLPIPPKLPTFPLTEAAGTSYLLELFQWAWPYSGRKPALTGAVEDKARAEAEQAQRDLIERVGRQDATWPTPKTLPEFGKHFIDKTPSFADTARAAYPHDAADQRRIMAQFIRRLRTFINYLAHIYKITPAQQCDDPFEEWTLIGVWYSLVCNIPKPKPR